jgi:major intracellular serine protease
MKLYPFTIKPTSILPVGILQNIQRTNAQNFWQFATAISPVAAVIDTGIDTNHSEFTGRIFKPRTFDGSAVMNDTIGHGTHVAGTIAGKTVGMMPWARVMPLKVAFGANAAMQIWEAFLAILDHNKTAPDEDKVVVLNCSFDGGVDPFMNYYIRALVESGVSVVAAAGNRGDGDPKTHECFGYPAYLWEVITTAALDSNDKVAGFSSSFDGVDISTPGVDIVSAAPGGGYQSMSGTSMATPHITGAILLIQAAYRKKYGKWATTDEVENILWKCVKPLQSDKKLTGRGALFMPNEIVKVETKQADVAPFIQNGRLMTSFRFVGEGFGASVDGNNLQAITAELNDRKLVLAKDKKPYTVETLLF